MKHIKTIAAVILTLAVGITASYLFFMTLDQKLKARFGTETETQELILLLETEIDTEKEENGNGKTETETVPEIVFESIEEIQPDLQTVSEGADEVATSVNDYEAVALAKALWGECRGVPSEAEKAAVVWCVLNRVDSPMFPDTIMEVLTAPKQIQGYSPEFPVEPELYDLATDVLSRWYAEKSGVENVGRVLPKEYCFFEGDGEHNHFTTEWLGTDYWTYELPNPYVS